MSAEILTRWLKKTPHSLVGTVPIVTEILLLKKNCDKEDPMHYLKPEERKSDNMLHLKNKAKLPDNSKKYFISDMNFLHSYSFLRYILTIKSFGHYLGNSCFWCHDFFLSTCVCCCIKA